MGRVNREQNAERGTHSYSMYVYVTTFSSLWIRTQREHNPEVRARQEAALFEVLHFTMLPKKCYHEYIAEHFKNPMTYKSRGPYADQCSYCTGAYKTFSGDVSKEHLIGALLANIFDRSAVKADKFVAFLTDKANMNKFKKPIWGNNAKVPAGQVHGLVLMLFAAN